MKAKSKAKAKSGTKEPQSFQLFDMLKSTAERMHQLGVMKNERRKVLAKAAAEIVSAMISNDPAIDSDSQLGQAVIAAARYLKQEFDQESAPEFPDPTATPEGEEPTSGGATNGGIGRKQSDMEAAS